MSKIIIFSLAFCFVYLVDAQSRCQNERNGNLLPAPSRNSFIRCSNGRDLMQTCPNGREFDPFERQCLEVPVQNSGSQSGIRQNQCVGHAEGTRLADPSSRTNYFKCTRGQAVRKSCPLNQEFNTQRSACQRVAPTRPPPTQSPVARQPPTRSNPPTRSPRRRQNK